MKRFLLLACAVIAEVSASLALKAALEHPGWYALVVIGYATSFLLLALVLREGLALGVAYGIWGAAGVALTSLMSAVIFGEPLTIMMTGGFLLIIGGVLCVELGTQKAANRKAVAAPMSWILLGAAIVFEIAGTLSLRASITGSRIWYAAVGAGYLLAFTMLSSPCARACRGGGLWHLDRSRYCLGRCTGQIPVQGAINAAHGRWHNSYLGRRAPRRSSVPRTKGPLPSVNHLDGRPRRRYRWPTWQNWPGGPPKDNVSGHCSERHQRHYPLDGRLHLRPCDS